MKFKVGDKVVYNGHEEWGVGTIVIIDYNDIADAASLGVDFKNCISRGHRLYLDGKHYSSDDHGYWISTWNAKLTNKNLLLLI